MLCYLTLLHNFFKLLTCLFYECKGSTCVLPFFKVRFYYLPAIYNDNQVFNIPKRGFFEFNKLHFLKALFEPH